MAVSNAFEKSIIIIIDLQFIVLKVIRWGSAHSVECFLRKMMDS